MYGRVKGLYHNASKNAWQFRPKDGQQHWMFYYERVYTHKQENECAQAIYKIRVLTGSCEQQSVFVEVISEIEAVYLAYEYANKFLQDMYPCNTLSPFCSLYNSVGRKRRS